MMLLGLNNGSKFLILAGMTRGAEVMGIFLLRGIDGDVFSLGKFDSRYSG